MKAYMVYDRIAGSGECAMLVFANTAKEAKKVSWAAYWCSEICESWIDWAVKLIRDCPEHLKGLDNGKVQVIESVDACPSCDSWGGWPMKFATEDDTEECDYEESECCSLCG